MRFQVETPEEKKVRMLSWHPWFAWYPVRLQDKTGRYTRDCRWLEKVQRKYRHHDEVYTGHFFHPIYKEMEK